jgi:hypothetical protein
MISFERSPFETFSLEINTEGRPPSVLSEGDKTWTGVIVSKL